MKQKRLNRQAPILFMIGGGLLLIIAAIMLSAQNTSTIPTSVAISEEEADARVPRVSLDEAKTAYAAGSAIFVDVRSPDVFQLEHISNAINIPLGAIESRLSELDPKQWIITYCT